MAGTRRARGKETTLSQELAGLLDGTVVPSLRKRVEQSEPVRAMLRAALESERSAGRTADDELAFRERFIEQIGASWILATVFVRFLEDRGWIAQRRIAGPGAEDSEELFGQAFEGLAGDAREYLLAVFRECGRLPGAREVLGPSALAALKLSPDAAAARAIVDFWREVEPFTDERGVEGTRLRWRFDSDDTRVLGDLYQDLSASVRERYALLQTPDFVERFILQYTLVPAMAQRGVEGLRLLDPTCGSGHFLLGAFEMIRGERQRRYPAESAKESAQRALACVHGVDLNPYAVAITRFRLLVAYARAVGLTRLREVERELGLEQRVVVADSLIPFGKQATLVDTLDDNAVREQWGGRGARLEDIGSTRAVFKQCYHVVVGNPPYITCKDAAQRDTIREAYPKSAFRSFALGAPFTERFFQLAEPEGYVGMINANSFMKREFGRPLIEDVLRHLDLTHVVDTSGAFIPGHGTPTVILFARNRRPELDTVRAVLGKRGEPSTPERAEEGQVWTSITSLIGQAGGESEFVSVADVGRATFDKHPWSLGGGGAGELKELIEQKCEQRLGDVVDAIGRTTVLGEDDAWLGTQADWERARVDSTRQLVIGEHVRDWGIASATWVPFPYDSHTLELSGAPQQVERALWPVRTPLESRTVFGKQVRQTGRRWYEYLEFYRDRLRSPLAITFAFVATHNHFVLDRGGKMFNRTAPIIKLPAAATEDDHLALLGWLNSSVACFWMKQVMMNKGATSDRGVLQDDPSKFRFEFDGTKLGRCPVPAALKTWRRGIIVDVARALDRLASELSIDAIRRCLGETVATDGSSPLAALLESRARKRAQMVALQEELDWLCYELVGIGEECVDARSQLSADDLTAIAPLEPEQRPFAGDGTSARHHAIRTDSNVGLIERGEFKRRWYRSAGRFDAEDVTDSLLVERVADELIADQLEIIVRDSATVVSVREVYASLIRNPRWLWIWSLAFPTVEISEGEVGRVMARDAIPHVAGLRFTALGWEKRQKWEQCWALQRREDAGESVGAIEVPPKYDSKDYRDARYWSLRGRLDVARERFIAYPGATTDDDSSPLYGWAGWNHRERADALAALYQQRKHDSGWGTEKLAGLLAGLSELVPWLQQWHNQREDGEEMSVGDAYSAFVSEEARELGLTAERLHDWGQGDEGNSPRPKPKPDSQPKPPKLSAADRRVALARAIADAARARPIAAFSVRDLLATVLEDDALANQVAAEAKKVEPSVWIAKLVAEFASPQALGLRYSDVVGRQFVERWLRWRAARVSASERAAMLAWDGPLEADAFASKALWALRGAADENRELFMSYGKVPLEHDEVELFGLRSWTTEQHLLALGGLFRSLRSEPTTADVLDDLLSALAFTLDSASPDELSVSFDGVDISRSFVEEQARIRALSYDDLLRRFGRRSKKKH